MPRSTEAPHPFARAAVTAFEVTREVGVSSELHTVEREGVKQRHNTKHGMKLSLDSQPLVPPFRTPREPAAFRKGVGDVKGNEPGAGYTQTQTSCVSEGVKGRISDPENGISNPQISAW